MKRIYSLAVITALGLGFSGCANNTDPMPIGNDAYTISGDRSYVYSEGNEFCNQKNMKFKALREGKIKADFASGLRTLDFKCLNENSKEYKNSNLYENPKDITLDSNVNVKK